MSYLKDGATSLPKDGIYIKQAEDWTKEYQDANKGKTKAFLIPNADLLSLLVEIGVLTDKGSGNYHHNKADDGVAAIRAYFGTDLTKTGTDQNRLVLCGAVDVGGEFQDQVKNSKDTLKVALAGDGVFDFGRPCPVVCSKNSPLFHK